MNISEEDAKAALTAIQNPPALYSDADKTTMTEATETDTTFTANATTLTAISGSSGKAATKVVKKKGAKPKLSAKEKKERSVRFS